MMRIHVFCEGQTEETFVKRVLQDQMNRHGIYLNPIIVRTSAISKGGIVSYAKLYRQLDRKCKEDRSSIVTTMIDLYGLPNDFPKKDEIDNLSDPFVKVTTAENAMKENINLTNFIPNIILHEYETLLFSDISKFKILFSDQEVNSLAKNIEGAASPEQINDNPLSAPSKRIQKIFQGYNKPFHGSLIAMEIGLDTMRIKCPHFDMWIKKIEQLKKAT